MILEKKVDGRFPMSSQKNKNCTFHGNVTQLKGIFEKDGIIMKMIKKRHK